MHTVLCACLLLLACALCTRAGELKEASTGHTFSDEHKGFGRLSLAGVGVRVKKIGPIHAKVYSVGLYLDKLSVGRKLGKLSFKDAKELRESKGFEGSVIEGPSDKGLVLKFARNVATNTLVEAIAESVKPQMNSDFQSLDKFQNALLTGLERTDGAKKNSIISFLSTATGSMVIKIDGSSAGTVQSEPLCNALMKVYMGQKSVTPALRESVADNICKWK